MPVVIALAWWKLRRWWRDAITDRVRWLIQDLQGKDIPAWEKTPTDEWLAPARRDLAEPRRKRGRR